MAIRKYVIILQFVVTCVFAGVITGYIKIFINDFIKTLQKR